MIHQAERALDEAQIADLHKRAHDLGIVVSEARKSGTLTFDRRAAEAAADSDVTAADALAALHTLDKLIDAKQASSQGLYPELR